LLFLCGGIKLVPDTFAPPVSNGGAMNKEQGTSNKELYIFSFFSVISP
jgi:hypothetical protein